MKKMEIKNKLIRGKQLHILFLVFVCFAANAVAQTKKPTAAEKKVIAEIAGMEEEYRQINITRDAAVFDRLHTDNYLISYSFPPKIMSKAEFLALLKDPAEKMTVASFTLDDVKIRAYGQATAVVTGKWQRISRGADGKSTNNGGRFTRVWVKQGGRWLVAAAHYTPAEDPLKRN
jgi:ketosteroid isomerase-like protein